MDQSIPRQLCFSVDVEWAHPAVLADLLNLFDDAGVCCTLFVTHEGVACGKHEKGIHPNFRRNGSLFQQLLQEHGDATWLLPEPEVYAYILNKTRQFAPEAKGSRSHALFWDSALPPLFAELGLEYDASVQIPLIGGLRPWFREHNIVMIPTWYADHADLVASYSEFQLNRLPLDTSGLKVFDFHPNLVYINAPSIPFYQSTKGFYHNPERLLLARHPGRGLRTLLLDLLEWVVRSGEQTYTLHEINTAVRRARIP
ncbi:MAG: hypothetical protein HQL55_20550 [Magnetococcales bacterium]|nr:hypothetical protein [Magnetococcales bacterium]